MTGEDAHLEEAYEDRWVSPDEDEDIDLIEDEDET